MVNNSENKTIKTKHKLFLKSTNLVQRLLTSRNPLSPLGLEQFL